MQVELEEIGAQVGGGDLSLALRSGDRKLVLAAAVAGPAARDAWVLLVPLAELAGTPDRPVAAAAAAAAVRIASDLEHAGSTLFYEPGDELGDALAGGLQAWREVSADTGLWADVRVHALEVGAHLSRIIDRETMEAALVARAGDANSEVRRAAFELMDPPLGAAARTKVVGALLGDPEPVVALAAAQALCSELAGKPAADRERIADVLAALGPDGLARLQGLVTDSTAKDVSLPPAALLDSARCLAADAGPASLAALKLLLKNEPIREPVRGLMPKQP